MSVRDAFDAAAGDYDRRLQRFVPDFQEFYGAVPEFAPFEREAELGVLDLGAGTGLLSEMVADRFPKAALTLVDFSEKMLDVARQRLAGRGDRFRFVAADYLEGPFLERYDLVVSALSVHHLGDEDKRRLFGTVRDTLAPGGYFVCADQVLGAAPEIGDRYWEDLIRRVRESGIEGQELDRFAERTREIHSHTFETPLTAQLSWLAEAGFEAVDCFYKRGRFAVYCGRKPERNETNVEDAEGSVE